MTQQPRVPWQVKYLALVLIWGSSFLLMKVGLESLSAVQISGLRILSGAAVISVLLLAKGGRLPTGARVWGHLFVCGFFLGALPFTLFALSETRISSALAGIGNATTPIVAVLATIAILPGERVTGSRLVAVLVGFLGVVTIMQPWTSVDRPDLVGFSMALVGGASYGIGWTYNRRFLSGVDLGGLSQPAATLLTALVLMVPVMLGWAAFQPEGLAAIWSYDTPDCRHLVLAAARVRARARAGRHRVRLHAPVRRRARRRPGHRLDDHLPDPGGVGAARGVRAR